MISFPETGDVVFSVRFSVGWVELSGAWVVGTVGTSRGWGANTATSEPSSAMAGSSWGVVSRREASWVWLVLRQYT